MWFTGEYDRKLDTKQRLAVPSEIRAKLDPRTHGSTLVLAPGSGRRLWLWPQLIFERKVEDMDRSLLPAEAAADFDEMFFSQVRPLEIDKTGRIRLPENMLKRFELGSAVTILGVRDHLVLWNTQQWRDRCARNMEEGHYDEVMYRPTQPDQG